MDELLHIGDVRQHMLQLVLCLKKIQEIQYLIA